MLKDHKSVMHLEGVAFNKVIRTTNGTEQVLNFLLFNDCKLEIRRFIHLFDDMYLFSIHIVTNTRINVPKQYKENRDVMPLLSIRKHQINIPPSSNFLQKLFHSLKHYRSLI